MKSFSHGTSQEIIDKIETISKQKTFKKPLIDFDDIIKENTNLYNRTWSQIFVLSYRSLIIGG